LQPFARIAATAVAAAVLLSACGGQSKDPSGGGIAQISPSARTQPAPATGATISGGKAQRATHPRGAASEQRHAQRGPDPVSRNVRPSRGRHAGKSEDRPSTAGPLGVNPCTLVTRSEAQAIVGAQVSKPQLGYQGPTCIFQSRRLKQTITVAVQRMSLPAVTRRGRNVVRTNVSGRQAVCLNYGGLKLMVPVTSGAVLTVGAPCQIATRMAVTALRRLH
jgi:hypothetical protein